MGTLFNQEPRKSHKLDEFTLDDLIVDIKKVSSENSIEFMDAVRVVEVFELRRKNNLQHSHSDIKDEQLSGFGELLERIALSMEKH